MIAAVTRARIGFWALKNKFGLKVFVLYGDLRNLPTTKPATVVCERHAPRLTPAISRDGS